MADIRAAQSGDFSAASTWVGGVVPGSGDVAYANTFTVTISDTRTVQAISNAAAGGATAGGAFSLLSGCNLTCTNANGIVQGVVSTTVPTTVDTNSLATGQTATITGNFDKIQSAGGTTRSTLTHSGSGTLNLIGNITNTGSAQTATVAFSGTGVLNYTGNITAGSAQSATGITVSAGGLLSVTGNVTGGSGHSTTHGILNISTGVVTINGTVTGGSSGTGISNNSSGTVTVNGPCQSSATQPAIGSGSTNQLTRLSGPFLLGVTGNINPIQASAWRWAPTQIPTYMEVNNSDGTTRRNLFTSDNIPSANYPTPANVRSGTVYGPNLENTGTLAVPSASSVALGVAVDNTTGTAVLTQAAVKSAVREELTTEMARIPNLGTINQMSEMLQNAFVPPP